MAHGRRVISIASKHGWGPGARYTNLRDIRHVQFSGTGFLDINWKKYCFTTHLDAVQLTKPLFTVARDIEDIADAPSIYAEARQLLRHSQNVIIVPKDRRLEDNLEQHIPPEFMLGFSVPTKYGGTVIAPEAFRRNVHLLGGRPDVQRSLANRMAVVSFDCNRFTLDAKFGDYFTGTKFVRHPIGGYETCLNASLANINRIWSDY